MKSKKQYQLTGNELILNVNKTNLFIRSTLFLFAFLFFSIPLVILLLAISFGFGMHIGYFILLFIFGLLGFYLLRIALWNTFGKEIIQISNAQINYIADYGWFKDGKKQVNISLDTTSPIEYRIRELGYEDENKGALIIEIGEEEIFCVTKMDVSEIEELIILLEYLDTIE